MKNTLFTALAVLLISICASAQSTVDSIAAKYELIAMPEALTIEKKFPALGTYILGNSTDATTNVTVTLDEVNKGIIWVEGLPQGKFKAYLKSSPASYRILSQKTDAGKQIPEGTLIFDQETNMLNIALGKPFDDANPAAIFLPQQDDVATVEIKSKSKGKAKTKTKITYYAASKVDQNTTSFSIE